MATPDGQQSLLLSATKEGETLAAMITRALRLASESQLTDEDPETLSWWRDELIELAASIIDQVVSRDIPEEPVAGERRYRIAHEVEDILWENKIEEQSTSLEGLQQQFGCSRRTIQLAIEEQFGLTFTSLKRLIRLYRVRNALQDHGASGSITDHAVEHGFNNLGRFAKNYQQVHGILPSETVRNRRQQ